MALWSDWGKRMVFFDGAMGTALQQAGLPAGTLPEIWNMERPEVVRAVHEGYLAVGCDVLTANTFGANRLKLTGSGYSVEKVVARGVAIARSAAAGHPGVRVALDMGSTGKLLKPLGDLGFEEAVEIFGEAAAAGEKAGADFALIETMGDTYEIKAAVLGIREHTELPVIATMIFDEQERLLTGGDVRAMAALLEGLGVDALGFNCGLGPEQMVPLVRQLRACTDLPILVQPNAGLPCIECGRTVFRVGPEEFASAMRRLAEAGAWAVGGCCGTTPEHLRETVRLCRDVTPRPIEPVSCTLVSSYARAVSIGGDPVLIGERINPTGKKRLKEALRTMDLDYILRLGAEQMEAGAHILDVNAGLPELDEAAVMARLVTELQGILPLPLQIDSADGETLARAMRVYNGKALVNSVSGKKASMETVFPLLKKYGGAVVALTLDEKGIPETAEGRLAVAHRIVDTAEAYGIRRRDIVVDVLTMTVGTDPDAAKVTLDALELVRRELGVRTSLGVSNVSFGLPQREKLNAAFYTMALTRGLDAAILNPSSAPMLEVWRNYRALTGLDGNCEDYIAHAAPQTSAAAPAAGEGMTLEAAVRRGLREAAAEAARALLETKGPMEVVEEALVPALDAVGRGYETGTVFLPQLLMAAEAAKAAFEVIRGRLDAAESRRGRIVLATVQGDIHDIGKNIVRALLENYGYAVTDLGRDVPVEAVVEAVRKEGAPLVGLSALMTTTVPSMEKTISALREAALDCRVMVGGAVLTEEYASRIGADFYGRDAMAAVRIARAFFD
ncbi:MAG TPA: homocysteine S-methyltransferase family protein [Oscillospiraceae bacterium]|nr:homocysteine S-methyltransferase family protein [Oscillospiraceae bacterium]